MNNKSVRNRQKITPKQIDYWTEPKRQLFEMVLESSLKRHEMAKELNISTRTVQRWIKDPSFHEALSMSSDAWKMQITARRLDLIKELIKGLRKRMEISINQVSPEVLLTEYRKLLFDIPLRISSVAIQQNVFPKKITSLPCLSPKKIKIVEKAVLKSQGYNELNVSKEDIEAVRKENALNKQ
jgi:hypothetical protein